MKLSKFLGIQPRNNCFRSLMQKILVFPPIKKMSNFITLWAKRNMNPKFTLMVNFNFRVRWNIQALLRMPTEKKEIQITWNILSKLPKDRSIIGDSHLIGTEFRSWWQNSRISHLLNVTNISNWSTNINSPFLFRVECLVWVSATL